MSITLLPELWAIIRGRGHMGVRDRCRLSWVCKWLRTLAPGPFLSAAWNTALADASRDARLRPFLWEWIEDEDRPPLSRLYRDDPDTIGVVEWAHAPYDRLPLRGARRSEGKCHCCWAEDVTFCRTLDDGGCDGHDIKIRSGGDGTHWTLLVTTCPRCRVYCTVLESDDISGSEFCDFFLLEAPSMNALCALFPDDLAAWIAAARPPDVPFLTDMGLPRIRHPDGSVCCVNGCGDCGNCTRECDYCG